MARLLERYHKEIVPRLAEKLGRKNKLSLPRLQKEMAIAASNVLLYCPTCKRGVRIGRRYAADGRKERFCKKCRTGLGSLSKARKAYASK